MGNKRSEIERETRKPSRFEGSYSGVDAGEIGGFGGESCHRILCYTVYVFFIVCVLNLTANTDRFGDVRVLFLRRLMRLGFFFWVGFLVGLRFFKWDGR